MDTMIKSSLNATSAALLGLLHDGHMTGGQLCSAADTRLAGFWTTTRSQVYRELPVLADMGYIHPLKKGMRASQPYVITPAGKREFQRWLSQDAGRDQLRNPLVLRVAFGKLHAPTQLRSLYAAQLEEHAQELKSLTHALSEAKKEGDIFRVATLEFAITYQDALVKWLLQTAPRV